MNLRYMMLALVVILSNTLSAQTMLGSVVNARFAPQGYSVPELFNNTSAIGTANPASLSEINAPAAGLNYKFASPVKDVYLKGYRGSRITNPMPASAGIVYPVGNFSFGLAMNQKYNLSIESVPIEVTTVEQPGGTGEFFTFTSERNIYDYSVISSYKMNNVISENTLSLGLKLSLSHLYFRDALWRIEAETDAYGFRFAFGLNYKILLPHENSIHVGASFEKGVNFDKNFTVPGSQFTLIPAGENPVQQLINDNYLLTGKTPDVLRFDVTLDVLPVLKFYESFSNVYWHGVSANYRNQFEFNSGVLYTPDETLAFSIGVFSTDRRTVFSVVNDDYQAIYLSAGLSVNIKNSSIGLAVYDSNLFSADTRKQTVAEISVGYHL